MPESVMRTPLFDSLSPLAGELMTEAVADTVAWRLAGNLKQLTLGLPVVPWRINNTPEWVPVQIVRAVRAKGPKDKPGYVLSFKALAGRPVSLVITKFWSNKFCRYVASTLGFNTRPPPETSRRLPVYLYRTPIELVTMRLEVLIAADFCRNGEPGFDKVACRGTLLDWNRNQMRLRDRIMPGYACPKGFKNVVLCYRCPVGYVECPAGTHRQTYVFKPCSRCKEDQAAFDPEMKSEVCLRCTEAAALARD